MGPGKDLSQRLVKDLFQKIEAQVRKEVDLLFQEAFNSVRWPRSSHPSSNSLKLNQKQAHLLKRSKNCLNLLVRIF